jgi:hypothetical protein
MKTEYNIIENNGGGLALVISNENGEDVYAVTFWDETGFAEIREMIAQLDYGPQKDVFAMWEGNELTEENPNYHYSVSDVIVWTNGKPKNQDRWGCAAKIALSEVPS